MSQTFKCEACRQPTAEESAEDMGGIVMCPKCAAEMREAIAKCPHVWEPYEGGECEPGVICGKCSAVREGISV